MSILPRSRQQYLGMRLEAVDGVSVDAIVDAVAAQYGSENRADAWSKLCGRSSRLDTYARVLPELRDSVTLTVSDMQNNEYRFSLPAVPRQQWKKYIDEETFSFLPRDKRFEADNLEYRTFDCGGKEVMYMRILGIYGRECLEYMYEQEMPGWQDNLAYFYNSFMKQPMPEDLMEALRRAPAFSERFAGMLSAMKERGIETLIIDLRGNSGGWTPITLATIYMLYGDDYLRTDMGTRTITRISPLYLEKVNSTLENFNNINGTQLRLGDYTHNDASDNNPADIGLLRTRFIDYAITASRELLRSLDGKPLYRPAHVYVVTDGGTFSAAFHYAFYLNHMGATVVGLPSGQAPNTYMEQTPFRLPRTGITGQISNSLQLFLPSDDPRAKEFTPDIVFTPEEYASCGWDHNAELVLLLRRIAAE